MASSSALQKVSLGVPAPAPHDVRVYHSNAGCTVAATGRYVILVVRDTINNTTLSVMRRAIADLCEHNPAFGILFVLEQGCQLLLPADIRSGMVASIKRQAPRCAAAAMVYEATGFHATALRSVVTAINVASRATHPTRVCANLPEGVSFLHEHAGGTPTLARLLQVAKQLRTLR